MIEIYNIVTTMGELSSFGDSLSFLSKDELKEFDLIGYTGKNSIGDKDNFESYLNRLNKGIFNVELKKRDNGNFCEKYSITRVSFEGTKWALIDYKDLSEKLEKLKELDEKVTRKNTILSTTISILDTVLKSCKR